MRAAGRCDLGQVFEDRQVTLEDDVVRSVLNVHVRLPGEIVNQAFVDTASAGKGRCDTAVVGKPCTDKRGYVPEEAAHEDSFGVGITHSLCLESLLVSA